MTAPTPAETARLLLDATDRLEELAEPPDASASGRPGKAADASVTSDRGLGDVGTRSVQRGAQQSGGVS